MSWDDRQPWKEFWKNLWEHIKPHLFYFFVSILFIYTLNIITIEGAIGKWVDKYLESQKLEFINQIPKILLGFLISMPAIGFSLSVFYYWRKITEPLAKIRADIDAIKKINYPLAFANTVRRLDSKTLFDVNRCIIPTNPLEGPQCKLYACDISSPYDWLTNDVLAYDAIFRAWLKKEGRELERILVWPQKDFISEIGLKVIEIQWMNAYRLHIFFTEDLYKLDRKKFIDNKLGTSTLQFMIWDIEKEESKIKGSPEPGRERSNCFGFSGKLNEKEGDPEYFIEWLGEDQFKTYTELWKHIKENADLLSGLIENHSRFKGKTPPNPGEFIEGGLRLIIKEQLELLIQEKSRERGLKRRKNIKRRID